MLRTSALLATVALLAPGLAVALAPPPLAFAGMDPIADARAALDLADAAPGTLAGEISHLARATLDATAALSDPRAAPSEALAALAPLVAAQAAAASALGADVAPTAGPAQARLALVQGKLAAVERAGPVQGLDGALALASDLASRAVIAPRSPLPPVPRHASARDALDALLAEHGLDAMETARLLAPLPALPPAQDEALREIVDAHLFQIAAAQLAVATGDQALLVAARAPVVDAVRAAAPALLARGSETRAAPEDGGADKTIEICGVVAIDLIPASSQYTCDVPLLVDAGGNDLYLNNAGGASEAVARAVKRPADCTDLVAFCPYLPGIVDCALASCVVPGGDADCRRAVANPAPASCPPPAALLVDADGDDRYQYAYQGTNAEFATCVRAVTGSAVTGSGFLFDLRGDDRYEPTIGCNFAANGAALTELSAATGFLFDGSGSDTYAPASLLGRPYPWRWLNTAQNGAAYGGDAFLLDAGGADVYEADGESATWLYANGAASVASDATLVDLEGGDAYSQDPGNVGFAQGASYLLSSALLVDTGSAGDRYLSLGSGAHAANGVASAASIGVLVDDGGANLFAGESCSTSGSCDSAAHLLNGVASYSAIAFDAVNAYTPGTTALLLSGAGDDTYETQASWTNSHGAAWNFGVAALVDQGGENSYHDRGLPNLAGAGLGQGHGRGLGAGLLVDLGERADFRIPAGYAGQGASASGVGVLLQKNEDKTTTYTADAGSLPSLVTGPGAGFRLTKGRGILLGVVPDFRCSGSIEIVGASITLIGNRAMEIHACTPDRTKIERFQNPVTGGDVPDVPKPPVACRAGPLAPACTVLVGGTFGEGAMDFLEDDHMEAAASGGLAYLSDVKSLTLRYNVPEADNTCRFACGVVWSALA